MISARAMTVMKKSSFIRLTPVHVQNARKRREVLNVRIVPVVGGCPRMEQIYPATQFISQNNQTIMHTMPAAKHHRALLA